MAYYSNYGHPQQMYPQQTPMMGQAAGPSGYMPIYAPPATSYTQAHTPFIPPGVMTETPPPTRSQHLGTKPRTKHSRRTETTPRPLKSAMKKPGGTGVAPAPVPPIYTEPSQSRRRTESKAKADDKYAALSSPSEACSSFSVYNDNHMFVTFKGDGELLLENTLDKARADIEKVIAIWPHGADSTLRGSTWSIRFRNTPWNMNGPDVEKAWALIIALFALFSSRLLAGILIYNNNQMHYCLTNADTRSTFFLAYFSRGGRRITLISPPYSVAVTFGPRIQALLSNQAEVTQDKGLTVVEVKRDIGGTGGVHPSHFLMQILKVMVDLGFDLNATIQMARGGPLGMGARRELFVFKGVAVV
ncbi:hypothetical protein FB45DRAFT_867204 [Roridomyces roridus]|uniref:Uncharacterized protein n=1 Tax=Roridomyces roridus TaxID=1738132 RepID=A0AAD7BUQ3_9AGAR|nr:hypothetical protein FB45DRAFT_867204 [Roridomyces roridus]